jgi:hypothetical protein
MRSKSIIQLLSVGALALAAAVPAYADAARCQTVEFSAAVLERFPRIREACLEVITRDGQEYAVLRADLLRVSRTSARLRPILPDGTRAEARNIAIDPARRVMVDGRAVRPSELAVGQVLSFYVQVTEPVAAFEPADEAPLAPMPLPAEEPAAAEPAPEMPATAGPLPLIGLTGLALLALGGGIGFARRRRA